MDCSIEAGAQVHNDGNHGPSISPLQAACLTKQYESAKYLIGKGAALDPRDTLEDSISLSPLFIAVSNNDIRTVDLLIQHGADVNLICPASFLPPENAPPLIPIWAAIQHGHLELARILLQSGAQIELKAVTSWTTLACFYILDALGVIDTCDYDTRIEVLITVLDLFAQIESNQKCVCDSGYGCECVSHITEDFGLPSKCRFTNSTGCGSGNPGECSMGRWICRSEACEFEECTCDRRMQTFRYEYRGFTADHILDRIIPSGDAVAATICTLAEHFPSSLPYLNRLIQESVWYHAANQSHNLVLALMIVADTKVSFEYTDLFRQLLLDLLSKDVDVSGHECRACPTPYFLALERGDAELCELLVRKGADTTISPGARYTTARIKYAAWRGSRRMLEVMLEHGADVNSSDICSPPHSIQCPLTSLDVPDVSIFDRYLVGIQEYLQSVHRFQERFKGCTAFELAVWTGHVDCASTLIANGATIGNHLSLNQKIRRTSLQRACERGDVEMIHLLLNHGADVNAPAAANYGVTALQAAAINGHFYVARILIAAGADVGAAASPVRGRTAISGAAERGRLDMVAYLLDNYQGTESVTTLCRRASKYARKQGYVALVEFLETRRQERQTELQSLSDDDSEGECYTEDDEDTENADESEDSNE